MLTFVPHKISEDYKKVEFYRINKDLCDNGLYKNLSPTAILLYSLLCDRLSVSYTNETNEKISKKKKHYYDDNGNVYVIFTRMDLEEKLHVGKSAISSGVNQLIKANLIKEVRQGRNLPNKIYVGKTISEINENFINWKSENQNSGSNILSYPDIRKSEANKINNKSKYNNYQGRDSSNMDWSQFYANPQFK